MTKLFLSVVITWGLVNILKPIIALIKSKEFNRKTLAASGGMPSGHPSLVASLTIVMYLETGLSPFFLTAIVITVIVIYDALKVRTIIEQQSKIINALTAGKAGYPKLDETVGHSLAEVIVSLILSIIIPVTIFTIF